LHTAPGGQTRTGQFPGASDYAAPEQIRGDRVDARADVYSLDCVLHHTLTGQPPTPAAATWPPRSPTSANPRGSTALAPDLPPALLRPKPNPHPNANSDHGCEDRPSLSARPPRTTPASRAADAGFRR